MSSVSNKLYVVTSNEEKDTLLSGAHKNRFHRSCKHHSGQAMPLCLLRTKSEFLVEIRNRNIGKTSPKLGGVLSAEETDLSSKRYTRKIGLVSGYHERLNRTFQADMYRRWLWFKGWQIQDDNFITKKPTFATDYLSLVAAEYSEHSLPRIWKLYVAVQVNHDEAPSVVNEEVLGTAKNLVENRTLGLNGMPNIARIVVGQHQVSISNFLRNAEGEFPD